MSDDIFAFELLASVVGISKKPLINILGDVLASCDIQKPIVGDEWFVFVYHWDDGAIDHKGAKLLDKIEG